MGKRSVPSAISAQAMAYIEGAPPLAAWPVNPKAIDEVRRHEREGCAPYADEARTLFVKTIAETEIAGVCVEVIEPKGGLRRKDTAVLYFHGGAFITGSPYEDLTITAGLAHRLGAKIYAPRYRLAPEHPFPAGLEDGLAVYGELGRDLGWDNLVVAGESAGGNLALGITLAAKSKGSGTPAALALMSPWSDVTDTGDTNRTLAGKDPTLDYDLHLADAAAAYAGGRSQSDPLISPLYADFGGGFPATMITSGTRDLLLSDCARLSTIMRQAGVDVRLHVWEGMWHVFEWYSDLPEAQTSLDEIAAFLEKNIEPA